MIRILTAFLLFSFSFPVFAEEVFERAEDVRPLLPGSAVPDVEFKGLDGSKMSLKEAVVSKPAVLIFYRGGW